MAIIPCPECHKQISDTAPACPHCGYVLSTAEIKQPEPTKIGEVSRNMPKGISEIALGFIIFLFGFPLLGFFFIGVLPILFGLVLMVEGGDVLFGTREFICPYCGQSHHIAKRTQRLKCSRCKMSSVRDGDYLTPAP